MHRFGSFCKCDNNQLQQFSSSGTYLLLNRIKMFCCVGHKFSFLSQPCEVVKSHALCAVPLMPAGTKNTMPRTSSQPPALPASPNPSLSGPPPSCPTYATSNASFAPRARTKSLPRRRSPSTPPSWTFFSPLHPALTCSFSRGGSSNGPTCLPRYFPPIEFQCCSVRRGCWRGFLWETGSCRLA